MPRIQSATPNGSLVEDPGSEGALVTQHAHKKYKRHRGEDTCPTPP
jgi:hypothetical protein